MVPSELGLVIFELSFIMITCFFIVYIFVRRCMRLRSMKRRSMASRPEISLIYDPSPRSSTMPHESSYTGRPTQLDASSKEKKSKSLPTGYELGLHPTRLGCNGKEVLI